MIAGRWMATRSPAKAGGEAARDFECPKVGSAVVPSVMSSAAAANFLAAHGAASLDQRVRELVRQLREQQPDLSATHLANMVNAAMCPAVAGMGNLSASDKRATLLHLSAGVEQQIAVMAPPPGSHVLTTVLQAPAAAVGGLTILGSARTRRRSR
jgi:hypothetical protein